MNCLMAALQWGEVSQMPNEPNPVIEFNNSQRWAILPKDHITILFLASMICHLKCDFSSGNWRKASWWWYDTRGLTQSNLSDASHLLQSLFYSHCWHSLQIHTNLTPVIWVVTIGNSFINSWSEPMFYILSCKSNIYGSYSFYKKSKTHRP